VVLDVFAFPAAVVHSALIVKIELEGDAVDMVASAADDVVVGDV
jgi:hypothetical protein